jgi:hypothetical protein
MFIYAKNERRSEPREQRIGMFRGELLLKVRSTRRSYLFTIIF